MRIAVNRRWQSGLASSPRMGIAALPPEAAAALVLLADQVAVGPAELELVIAAWLRAPHLIVAAGVGDVLGPPALFPRGAFGALLRLRGDAGAGKLLASMRGRILALEMPESAVDIDHKRDLERIRRRIRQS